MTPRNLHSTPLSRRQAISLIGAGAGLGLISGFRSEHALLAWPGQVASAKALTFPKGAIIRTILRDVPPEALAMGQTLFHEHLDGEYSRTERQLKLPPPSTADIIPIVNEIKMAARDGVVCIVDGGHPDMGGDAGKPLDPLRHELRVLDMVRLGIHRCDANAETEP